jgi:chorismate mutase
MGRGGEQTKIQVKQAFFIIKVSNKQSPSSITFIYYSTTLRVSAYFPAVIRRNLLT